MARGQLIAVHVSPDDSYNVRWTRERRLKPAWRWTVRVLTGHGHGYGIHPTLSYRMFKTYSAALSAIERS